MRSLSPSLCQFSVLRVYETIATQIRGKSKEMFKSPRFEPGMSQLLMPHASPLANSATTVPPALLVSLDWHVPEYSRFSVFCHRNWFIFVVFILHFDIILCLHIVQERCVAALLCLCMNSVWASSGIGLRQGGHLFLGIASKFFTLFWCHFSESSFSSSWS